MVSEWLFPRVKKVRSFQNFICVIRQPPWPVSQSFLPTDVKEKLSHTHTQQGWSDKVRCLKTQRAGNCITIIPRPCRVQRDIPLDRSSLGLSAANIRKVGPKWSLPHNVIWFWVTVRDPLGWEDKFHHRIVPKVLPICASLALTVWH